MVTKKLETDVASRKRKRVIPTREAGSRANPVYDNPADELFAEAFAAIDKKIVTSEDLVTKNEFVVDHKVASVVNQSFNKVVDHKTENRSTTDSDVVNNPTLTSNVVDLKTTIPEKHEKKVNKITTQQNVVNHKKRNWSTTDRQRSEYSESVESFRTSNEFKRKIKVFCAEQGIDKQDFYRLVVNHYFETVVDHQLENVVNNPTLEDRRLILYKTAPVIINLFREYNKTFNPQTDWKPKDDAVGVSYNQVDLRIVEIGILITQINILENQTGTKVERFKYYTREIDKMKIMGYKPETLDEILKSYRRVWQSLSKREIDLSFLKNTDEK